METFHTVSEASAERQAFYARMAARSVAPLWEVLGSLVLPAPRSPCVPALWRYEEIRPFLMEAGALISEREAERRVLVLENPALPGQSRVTQSLFAGLQIVLPGEVARSHRHTASALRFIVEGDGAYTAVEGERAIMHPGDLILTPSWTFHDHGNPSDVPVVWLDGLDIPIVNLFDTSFAERHRDETPALVRPDGDALARFGTNLLPVEYSSARPSSPMFTYPYARSREALDRLFRHGPVDPRYGVKVQYVNPATGGYPMPTIAAFLQLMPAGFKGALHRSTDATVYAVVEGRGQTRIGETTVAWGPRDIFVVPSWHGVVHEANEEAVLFSFSDRAAQKALGLWREE